ncbi:MAG: hypothetical protein A2511_06435 [Deltaproteobacteria bacterium RIFOXYD12_FULL_50_9]|nr:MAG: hypothetical protein A2511_06435 [Deltaproteobacteria bacterium RIFOXYD12_FULL_50_9]
MIMIQKIFARIILFFLPILLVPGVLKAESTLKLALDRDQATLGDSVRLSLSVEGGSGGEAPQIAGLEDFQVRSGGTSSQFQFINGKTSRSFAYTFFLQPTRTGTFTIGPARLNIEGRTAASNTVRLAVTNQTAIPGGAAGNHSTLFMTAEVSPKDAYHEQQLIYTLKLFRQIRVSDVSVTLPKTDGLTFKQLGEPRQYQSNAAGRSYEVLEVSYILNVSRPGTLAIEPASMQMMVFDQSRRAPHGFPDEMFFGAAQGHPVSIQSEALKLSVRQLPQEGRPANFSGLLGDFRIKAACDPLQLKAGDSAALTVQVAGQGNINRIPDLNLPEITGLKVYADQPKLESGSGSQSNSGTKTMKWAIVPQRQGTYTIPGLALSYFDTGTRSYKTISTGPQTLTVLPGERPAGQSLQPPVGGATDTVRPKREVEALGHDILPIHTSAQDLSAGRDIEYHKALAIIILFIPGLVCLAMFLYLRFKGQSMTQTRALRARKAARVFSDTMHQGELSASQILERVRVYINERFGLSVGLITPEEVRVILSERQVARELIDRLHAVLAGLQQAVYTGHGDQPAAPGEDLVELIARIDKEAR